jgi:two-component system, chemotaxis family, protein-glutamate methylesterase/glutaminase
VISSAPVRVLVVDDSAFARKVLREALSSDGDIQVVGFARDGLEALEKIAELTPDVVTLDLMMPGLDGLGVLRALPQESRPRVVVVSISDADSALGVEALQNGAIDLVHKPTALATDRLYELSGELVRKVKGAAAATVRTPAPAPASRAAEPIARSHGIELVVIGTSTGGPQALTRLLTELPGDLPCAVAVALHIPAGYTEALARRLNEACALEVFEAASGAPLLPGKVAIARGGTHLLVRREQGQLITDLDPTSRGTPFCPSVDVLFGSAAAVTGAATLGLVLTGMGDDGLEGSRAIKQAGGRILNEAESSCVVYGMPRVIREAGLSSGEAPIEKMAQLLRRSL